MPNAKLFYVGPDEPAGGLPQARDEIREVTMPRVAVASGIEIGEAGLRSQPHCLRRDRLARLALFHQPKPIAQHRCDALSGRCR